MLRSHLLPHRSDIRFPEILALNIGFLQEYYSVLYAENNLEDETFSVVRLAKEIGLSRSQLHRKLKQISNHNTSEYITMFKIRKATTLLASKKYNIDEVAFRAGFNSHSYFTKCFKRIHSLTPKEFLKSLEVKL